MTRNSIRPILIGLTSLLMWLLSAGAGAQQETISIDKAAELLKAKGYVLFMRHSQTVPGIGDPPEFELKKCPTQRNLSKEGQDHARQLGESFRKAGIQIDQVHNSQWCRCRDTAQLAFGKEKARDWPVINSFFQDRSTEPEQTKQLKARAVQWAAGKPVNVMLVSHQVNISAALSTFTRQGEIVITRVKDGEFDIVARIAP